MPHILINILYTSLFERSQNKALLAGIVTLLLVNLTESGPVALKNAGDSGDYTPSFGTRLLRKRSPTVNERPGCKPGAAASPNRVNTT
jgi:hypothetical protein